VAVVSLTCSVDEPHPLTNGTTARLKSEIAILVEFFIT
jgi:hypothetical protein